MPNPICRKLSQTAAPVPFEWPGSDRHVKQAQGHANIPEERRDLKKKQGQNKIKRTVTVGAAAVLLPTAERHGSPRVRPRAKVLCSCTDIRGRLGGKACSCRDVRSSPGKVGCSSVDAPWRGGRFPGRILDVRTRPGKGRRSFRDVQDRPGKWSGRSPDVRSATRGQVLPDLGRSSRNGEKVLRGLNCDSRSGTRAASEAADRGRSTPKIKPQRGPCDSRPEKAQRHLRSRSSDGGPGERERRRRPRSRPERSGVAGKKECARRFPRTSPGEYRSNG